MHHVWLWSITRGLFCYREPCEGDLDVGAYEVFLLAPKHMLEVGHDGGVHPRQAVSLVDPHQELGTLPRRRNAHGNQQVPHSFS